jgi:hypothetical protein
VGLLLDAALVVLAVLVCGSLAMLAWTLGVAGPASLRDEVRRVASLRDRLTDAERALPARASALREGLRQLSRTLKGEA